MLKLYIFVTELEKFCRAFTVVPPNVVSRSPEEDGRQVVM